MGARIDYSKVSPGVLEVMFGFGKYLHTSRLPKPLLDLVYL